MNLVEIFFGIITRQAIRRGSFDSVRELVDAIRRFIDGWNERCEPFLWTKDADTILAKQSVKLLPTRDTSLQTELSPRVLLAESDAGTALC